MTMDWTDWWWADAAARFVGFAVLGRCWLGPWIWWLAKRTICRTRFWTLGLYRRLVDDHSADPPPPPQTVVCRCCGGVRLNAMVDRWAVVTGCTDGIGRDYALQLAARGMNVALVSRNVNKLNVVAAEIRENYGDARLTRCVVADFTTTGSPNNKLSETYETVARELGDLDVAVLVNNAGIGYPRPEFLLELGSDVGAKISHQLFRDIIECNALTPVVLCRIVMPLMMGFVGGNGQSDDRVEKKSSNGNDERKNELKPTSRGGLVINVSSASAMLPCPMLTVYAATKVFLEKFSVELAAEYDSTDTVLSTKYTRNNCIYSCPRIAVRCLTPGFVATKMSKLRSSGSMIPEPKQYVQSSLNALECRCGCNIWRANSTQLGWLADVVSSTFNSFASPWSSVGNAAGDDTTLTGYVPHTLMIKMVGVAKWLFGTDLVKSRARRILLGIKKRKASHEKKKRWQE